MLGFYADATVEKLEEACSTNYQTVGHRTLALPIAFTHCDSCMPGWTSSKSYHDGNWDNCLWLLTNNPGKSGEWQGLLGSFAQRISMTQFRRADKFTRHHGHARVIGNFSSFQNHLKRFIKKIGLVISPDLTLARLGSLLCW